MLLARTATPTANARAEDTVSKMLPPVFGNTTADATVADAMMDRLIQKNHRIVLTGESLRQASKIIKKEKKTDLS